jgi:4-amino-4-deoxy-L-arabinose transferase-like glycosyltransferase
LNESKKSDRIPWLLLAACSAVLLLAYTWAAPFRHLYGLEARNALFAREMLANGFSMIPTALGKPYPDYPGLYFWIETAFSRLGGQVSTLSAVLPSASFAVGCVVIAFLLGARINRRTGWFAAAVLSTFPEFWLRASQATIDMALAFWVSAAVACLFLGDEGMPTRSALFTTGALVCMALAFFTKGPIGIVLPAGAWGIYLLGHRRFKAFWRFAAIGFALAAACVAVQVWTVWHVGGEQLMQAVIRQQISGRFGNPSTHPPYYYLTSLLANGGIWLLVALPAVAAWLKRHRKANTGGTWRQMLPRRDVTRLALGWLALTFTIFTLASTRHSRYLLPLYPALAVLVAAGLDGMLRQEYRRLWIPDKIITGLIALIILAGALGATLAADRIFVPPAFIVIWIVAVAGIWAVVCTRIETGTTQVALISLLLATGLSGANLLIIPQLSHEASGRQFTELAEAAVDPKIPAVLYRIKPDGDGIKYALYSKRRPASLCFVATESALKALPAPYLLISRNTCQSTAWKSILADKTIEPVACGKIRSHRFSADLIEPGPPAVGKGDLKE